LQSIDLAMPSGSSGDDLSMSAPADMKTPHDLAKPADLLSCQPTGGPCPNKNDAICCSKYCIYSSSTCK
jgi:hypothetical protein